MYQTALAPNAALLSARYLLNDRASVSDNFNTRVPVRLAARNARLRDMAGRACVKLCGH